MKSLTRAIALSAACLAAVPALATTLVPIDDDKLVDRARLIVDATVEAQVPSTASFPATDWMLRIDRVLKGEYDQGSLIVRVPGGVGPDGLATRFYGAPPLAVGVRGIVFLQTRKDGTWKVSDFPQGAFVAATTGRRTLAVRDYSEVTLVEKSGRVGGYEPFRDFDRFSTWITDRASGKKRRADYIVKPQRSELQTITENFVLTTADDGLPVRWFDFDGGGSVPWRVNPANAPGLPSGGANEITRALAAWTNEPTTPIRLVYAGTSASTKGLTKNDGLNVVIWGDPNNEEETTYNCGTGGVLAFASPWYYPSQKRSFSGKFYHPIVEGDVIFNNGFECNQFSSSNYSKMVEEIAAHEIGHTLGLSHSSEKKFEPNPVLRDALMYAYSHNDGRGARLNSDDVQAIQSLYRPGGIIGGGGGGGGGGTAGCPAGTLCLLSKRFQVSVTWENQFNNTTGVGTPISYSDFAGVFHFTADPRDLTLFVKIVNFDGRILVFYSEMTVLKFKLTVTDTLTGKSKTYSNTANDCGAIDNDFVGGTLGVTSGGTKATIRDLGVTQAPGKCKPDGQTLCLINSRFQVRVPSWRNQFNGTSGTGSALPTSDLSGSFYFTPDPRNLEILFKMNQFPDRFLVFFGTVSVLDYTILLTDTVTGRTTEFHNPPGTFCGGFVNDLLAGPPF